MKTISFHSHRGGTGRSLCLSNCAVYLAMQGEKVLILDMDIDAGGLSIIFKGIPEGIVTDKPTGLLKILSEDLSENFTQAIETFDDFEIAKLYPLNGKLDFIFIEPHTFWTDQIQKKSSASNAFISQIKNLKQNILAECDFTYLLVDLPAGINAIRDAFFEISDTVVVLTRPNRQGAFGARMCLDDLHEQGLNTLFILSNVPSPSSCASKKRIEEFLTMGAFAATELTNIIPYDESLAFYEELTVLTRPDDEVSKAYIEIARNIQR